MKQNTITTAEATQNLTTTINDLNAAVRAEASVSRIAALEQSAKEAAKTLSACKRMDEYLTLKNAENPMTEAIEKLTVDSVKVKKNNDDGVITYTAETSASPIDFPAFVRFCAPKSVVPNSGFEYRLQGLARMFAARNGKDIVSEATAKDILTSYKVSSKVAEEATVWSNKKMATEIQSIVNDIVSNEDGHIKVTSYDVKFLEAVVTKHGKESLSVSLEGTKKFCTYFFEMLHRLMFNKAYTVEYKAKKAE